MAAAGSRLVTAMSRPFVKRALVALAVGVLLNVAISGALAAFIGVPPRPAKQVQAVQPDRWPRTVSAEWPKPTGVHTRRWWCCTMIDAVGYTRIPEERGPDFVSRATHESAYTLMLRQWGWPMRSLEYQWTHTQPMLVNVWLFKPPAEASLRTGLPVSTSITRSPERTHLPLMPVWPGFVVNSLFYAAVAGAILFAPGAVRRARRRRRGRCLACGYDVRGLDTCPECGAPGQRAQGPNGTTGR